MDRLLGADLMIKILATGIKLEDNFGGPSILHGLNQTLKELYGDDYELVYYQTTPFNDYSISDFNFKVMTIPFTRDNISIGLLGKDMKNYIKEVRSSDILVDLLGICFSDIKNKKNNNFFKSLLKTLYVFRMLLIGKIFRKTTVKNTCSFGPIKTKNTIMVASFACKYLFDKVSARETKSLDALLSYAKVDKEILLSPDVANIMPYSKNKTYDKKSVGISISHQVIRQWEGEIDYTEGMVNLCRHIFQKYKLPIIMIPNEVQSLIDYNDIDVSKEIQNSLEKQGINVDIVDSKTMSSTELKNVIASCEVVIASRYHSCVAALSSGVPTLVIGWHYKYEELLHWYGQEKWGIPTKEFTTEKLISTFDSFWENREKSKKIIAEKYPEVKKAVLETGKILFTK